MADAETPAAGTIQNTDAGSQPPAAGAVPPAVPPTPPEGEAPKPGQTDAKDAPPAAPEKYELKMPEGFTVNETVMEKFSALAKSKNLTNDEANAFAGIVVEMRQAEAAQVDTYWEETFTKWDSELKKDPEFGGQHYDETLKNTQAAFARFGDAESKALFDKPEFGRNPALVRLFARIGKASSEAGMVMPGAAGNAKTAKDFYAKSGMNP